MGQRFLSADAASSVPKHCCWHAQSCPVLLKIGYDLQGGHGLQLERIPQHDIAVQAPAGNEAVGLAPANSPDPPCVTLQVLDSHPGLHIRQAEALVQGTGQDAVELTDILQLADPVCV